jgi:hypothetical protein
MAAERLEWVLVPRFLIYPKIRISEFSEKTENKTKAKTPRF